MFCLGNLSIVFLLFYFHLTFLYAQNNEDSNEGTVQSLFLQKSGIPSATSWARLSTSFMELDDFTVCYRIQLHRFREESTLMSYAVSDSKDNELRMDHRTTGYKVSIHSTWAKTNILTTLGEWHHFCVTYDSSSEEWKIYVDGFISDQGYLPKYFGPLEGNGAYIIGQEQDSFGGDFQRDQSFSGEITQLNFWSDVLNEREISKVADCESQIEGDIMAWSEMEWQLNGETEWITRNINDFCKMSKRKFVFFNDRLSLHASLQLCQVVGGILAVPTNSHENTLVYDISKQEAEFCAGELGASYLWMGANDIENEKVWAYSGNLTALSWEGPWRGGAPNGGIVENCLVMLHGDFASQWSDMACLETYSLCFVCEFPYFIPLFLKGSILCSTSPFNFEYFLDGDRNGKPLIAGVLHSEIYWDNSSDTWILRSLKTPNAVAKYQKRLGKNYPFGKGSWMLDFETCGIAKGQIVNLTLSACSSSEFTCMDGMCIPLKYRCNLRKDCLDFSDEADCNYIIIPNGYMKFIPPPSRNETIPLQIFISVHIISFSAIKTQDLIFETATEVILTWKDRRLVYKNLKIETYLNRVSDEHSNRIWTPKIFLKNAYGNSITNSKPQIFCIAQGNSTFATYEIEEEMNIFAGHENSLQMQQYAQASYACDFDLLMFPFDIQYCYLDFTLTTASASYLDLVPDVIDYVGNIYLIEYEIGRVTINKTKDSDLFSSVRITVRFIRRYGFYLLTLYIPTVLLVSIAYATLFFDPADFNSKIVVAITALLVLNTLFTQTTNSLPKTSYFKLIDIWLFFSIVIIFLVIMFHALVEYFSYESLIEAKAFGNRKMQKFKVRPISTEKPRSAWKDEMPQLFGLPINIIFLFIGRVTIPLMYLVFNMAYWGISIHYLAVEVLPQQHIDETE